MAKRSHGKLSFLDVRDGSGDIQLLLGKDDGERSLSVGDIVGASGEVITSRRGELSVSVGELELLARCRRPMPEKWRGLTDVDTRYRRRYLDLLLNPRSRSTVRMRAAANAAMRDFMVDRGFIEIETPMLQPVASGAVARPFVTHHNALDMDLYLRVAPELYLKRVLIAGFDRVFELNRSFRNEGFSTRHNPEFTVLEGYEAYVDYNRTMDLVEDLVRAIAAAVTGLIEDGELPFDVSEPFRRLDMFEAIEEVLGLRLRPAWDAHDRPSIVRAAENLGLPAKDDMPLGRVIFDIYEDHVEKGLSGATFVMGFPKEVSPLARSHRSIEGFAEHADLVLNGIEVCPIYSELNDPVEQAERFRQQALARKGGEEAAMPDAEFIDALEYAMPPAGGFGLGVDRVLAILSGLGSLREVILFPTLRPLPR